MHSNPMYIYHPVLSLCLSTVAVLAAPTAQHNAVAKPTFPFTRMIAFGDNLSDNGNGSYAHCLADRNHCNNSIYGYRTWTNGPVAVSYLTDLIGIPLAVDYAFGGANGGANIGATINNSYTMSKYAPDAFTQVKNYTSTRNLKRSTVQTSLHFLWIGNNDISLAHLSTTSPINTRFATEMATQMAELVTRLITAGAKYIFVPGMYPKQLSAARRYLASNAIQIENLGLAIDQANTAIKAKLATSFGPEVVYYDVFDFMVKLYNNHNASGIQYILPDYCDGYSQADFNLCITQKHGELFYWTQQTDPTTRVHSLVASDMFRVIKAKYAL